jgi:hypothetical protein
VKDSERYVEFCKARLATIAPVTGDVFRQQRNIRTLPMEPVGCWNCFTVAGM